MRGMRVGVGGRTPHPACGHLLPSSEEGRRRVLYAPVVTPRSLTPARSHPLALALAHLHCLPHTAVHVCFGPGALEPRLLRA